MRQMKSNSPQDEQRSGREGKSVAVPFMPSRFSLLLVACRRVSNGQIALPTENILPPRKKGVLSTR